MPDEYWIAGRPATFATKSEATWKNKIIDEIGNRRNKNSSLVLYFNIKKENYNKYAFDIDNLCDPVFLHLHQSLAGITDGRPILSVGEQVKMKMKMKAYLSMMLKQ